MPGTSLLQTYNSIATTTRDKYRTRKATDNVSLANRLTSLKKKGRLKGAKKAKFDKTMHEWGQNNLHTGSKSGPIVPKSKQKQALAIAFSQARKA